MDSSKSPLRLGVIGCGNVLEAYRLALDDLELRGWAMVQAVCGRETQRSRAESLFPGTAFLTNADDIISSPEIDGIVILTSMAEHARLAMAALGSGKHVLVEKPMATTLDDAQELLDCARRSRGLLMCAPFTVLSPTFRIIGHRVSRGEIGKICSARARYGWAGPWWSEWFYRQEGGCLFDLGVYCLTSLTGLLGPVRRVSAMCNVAIPERVVNGRPVQVTVEDNAQVLLEFESDALGVVTTGFTMQQYRSPALELYGATGTLQMLGDDWDPDGYELWQNAVGGWLLFKETHPNWSWTDGLRHLVECVRTGTRPIVTPEQAFHVLEIMVKARESSRTGAAVKVSSRFKALEFRDVAAHEAAHLSHDRTRERK